MEKPRATFLLTREMREWLGFVGIRDVVDPFGEVGYVSTHANIRRKASTCDIHLASISQLLASSRCSVSSVVR